MPLSFQHAIVRKPGPSIIEGLTSHPDLGCPDFATAMAQHQSYVDALEACGVVVTIMEADSRFPDACFIEDTAVCTDRMAVLTRPGAPSRLHETGAVAKTLRRYFDVLEEIEPPGTLEGGDVMMVGDHFYIGLSRRTNRHGAQQLLALLSRHGKSGSMVNMDDMLHLKTGLAYLEDDILLATGEFTKNEICKQFKTIVVPDEEAYAANAIRVNRHVLVPAGYPRTLERLCEMGLDVITVDTSEFRKLDGGLSCLSLRF